MFQQTLDPPLEEHTCRFTNISVCTYSAWVLLSLECPVLGAGRLLWKWVVFVPYNSRDHSPLTAFLTRGKQVSRVGRETRSCLMAHVNSAESGVRPLKFRTPGKYFLYFAPPPFSLFVCSEAVCKMAVPSSG